jgi:hypothetical protein
MSGSKPLVTSASVREYFELAVSEALEKQPLSATLGAAGYLVDVLCHYATADVEQLLRPVGVLLVRVEKKSAGALKLSELKQVGDQSLYLSGFFWENVKRRRLDPEYFSQVGGRAYTQLAKAFDRRQSDSALSEIYAELASDFRSFVDVLFQVRRQGEPKADLPTLYEQWLDTGSATIERELREAGMVLPNSNSNTDPEGPGN